MTEANANVFVQAERVGRKYRVGEAEVVALETASCMVKPGDRIALVGPSGSGKSTLLQLLGGLEEPTEGSVVWPLLGNQARLRPRQVGFIYQHPSLLAPLTAIENVELPLLLMNSSPEEAREAAMLTLRRLELERLAHQLPEELSGGQAQRIAVARAMVVQPRLILADEPTGQLDLTTAEHLIDTLFAALKNTDTALVIATHDEKVTRRMDTVWRMSRGRLEPESI